MTDAPVLTNDIEPLMPPLFRYFADRPKALHFIGDALDDIENADSDCELSWPEVLYQAFVKARATAEDGEPSDIETGRTGGPVTVPG